MGRAHLFEFNDQPWLPAFLRDAMTGYLETLSRKMKLHEPMTPIIEAALDRSGAEQIVDLCSGGGGPLLQIRERLSKPVPVVMTDLFPNAAAFKALQAPGVSARMTPVDATDVPDDLPGLRTIFNGFHHFQPELARAILEDAHKKRAPIAIIELSERTAANILGAPLIPLFTFLLMPFVRPARALPLIFTYLIPILPTLIAWDGLVSHLRVYSPDELKALTAGLDEGGYTWEIQRAPLMPGAHMTVLTGCVPRKR